MRNNPVSPDKIVLFAKQSGSTSFSSLYTIKHAFGTSKVGHTGTLDSFACGLLVVCTGALTRLAGRITEFDKTYEAVIKFGSETDTLECTGSVVRTASLPSVKAVEDAVLHFKGEQYQVPPLFSAIHIDGKRASDIARAGKTAEVPSRKITVYESSIKNIDVTEENLVNAVHIVFRVSKGTYIRSLARDIGLFCNSAAHLAGLYRTEVGGFRISDAAGFSMLGEFSISSALDNAERLRSLDAERRNTGDNSLPEEAGKKIRKKRTFPAHTLLYDGSELQTEVREKAINMNRSLAVQCGFFCLTLNDGSVCEFMNGAKLHSSMFDISPFLVQEEYAAVFTKEEKFAGLLQKSSSGYFKYAFVVPSA